MKILKSALIGCALLFSFYRIAIGADVDWPKKPIVAIVAFPAGGSTDSFARNIASNLGEALGQSVMVDNRPGAGGMIGLQAAAKAAPDGYTIFFGALTNQAISHSLFANATVDMRKDLTPVALMGTIPHLLVVNPSVPAKNLTELIAFIKSKNGNFNYASQGNGSLSHIEATLFMQRIGATGTHVPYKGSSFALPDLIAGNTLMMFDSVTASLPHIQSGKLRAIAMASAERSPLLPNVPTLSQEGMKNFDVENLYAVYVPKGTPPAIVDRLDNALAKIAANKNNQARLASQGIRVHYENAEHLAVITNTEFEKWAKIVKLANLKID